MQKQTAKLVSKWVVVAAWMTSGLLVQTAQAQALADKVPGDAVAYVGWAGAEKAKANFPGTHFEAVLNESRVNELFGSYLDQLEKQIVKREPKAAEPFRLLRTLGAPVWKYPTAAYVAKPDLSDMDKPKFTFALLSQAGSEAESVAAEVQKLLPKQKRNEPFLSVKAESGIVIFTISSDATPLTSSGAPLASTARFTNTLKQVQADAVITKYIDLEAITALIETGVTAEEPENAAKLKAFLDQSGLRGVKQVISTSGFAGKNWANDCFVATDSQRGGLLNAVPTGPTDPSLLAGVPASAAIVKTLRFDPAVLAKEMRTTLEKTDAEAVKYYNYGFGGLQQALGTNVEMNILEPLGTDWVIYGAPEIGSGGLLGLVAVNKVDDAKTLKKGLVTASINLVNWINIAISKSGNDVPVRIHGTKVKIGDAEVNYIATPILAPSWAIDGDKLYLGLYPQTVGAAIRQAKSGKPSIAQSDAFTKAVKTLGQSNLDTVGYFDLPTAAKHGSMYTTLLMIGRYAGMADLFAPPLPEPLLPPNDILLANLEPAVEGSWSDTAGYHWRSVQSFPGAMLLSEQTAAMSAGVATPALMTSILLPSLNRARETANRVQSASNLRQIGVGILLYANENRNNYPPSLAELITTQDLVLPIFDNPRGGNDLTQPPQEIFNDPALLGQFVVENSDYIYIGAGMTNSVNAEAIVAYENPEGLDDGINILFGDGHVEFWPMDRALEMIADQQAKAGGV